MSALEEVRKLVDRFDSNYAEFKSGKFNETQVRVDFIDPLMSLLGWDVNNQQGQPAAYRDVIHEDTIKISGGTKAPDYGFYVGGGRKFFLEAKKPSVDIAGAVAPATQLRRYAWSAKLPLSLLTDFEELSVYDCRIEPKQGDKSDTARLEYFTYTEYADRWDEIAALFSREAVMNGSLDSYAEEAKRKRGTKTVDDAFLAEIEGWRSSLARDLAFRNNLNQRQLNYAVQMTIDRIIFLRMTEGRGIEEYERLLKLTDGSDVYRKMREVFKDADDRYNSGLFHFKNERGREEEPDNLTLELEIGDDLLKEIIGGLYYPQSPYEFAVLPVDVLGQVYEQFLGSVIRLEDAQGSSGNGAVVEQKPEVRKAGGVYYTPTYIVDYIVQNTVGKLLEGKKPGPRGGASNLKIVDPACGSGSFLLGAYRYLLDWHRDKYLEDGLEKHAKRLYQGQGEQWYLTIDEKKRILLNNIYGVDIDPQAVEVTKLSLLLKVLEGETGESITQQLALIQERALPDLDDNIKCGNTLIGSDFYEERDLTLFEEEDFYRINVFDWGERFPQVFEGRDPGFDAVIGNPPYIDSEWMTSYLPLEREYCSSRYESASGNWDIFCAFIEQSLNICKPNGLASFIVPNKLGSAGYASEARRVLAIENRLLSIRDYSRTPVFPVAVYPIVYIAQKTARATKDTVRYERMTVAADGRIENSGTHKLEYERYFGQRSPTWPIFSSINEADPATRMRVDFPTLGFVTEEVSGAATVAEAYEIKPLIEDLPPHEDNGDDSILKLVNSGTIDRYQTLWAEKNCRYLGDSYSKPIIPLSEEHKLPTRRRRQSRSSKIVIAGMTKVLECTLDSEGSVLAGKSTTVVFATLDLRYLLGLLNSKLIYFYYESVFGGDRLQGGYLRIGPPQLRTIPIRTIDFSNKADVERHDRMVELVEQMLELHERLSAAKIAQERKIIGQQIDATDRQINRLVYELYELTDDEIETVEEATAR